MNADEERELENGNDVDYRSEDDDSGGEGEDEANEGNNSASEGRDEGGSSGGLDQGNEGSREDWAHLHEYWDSDVDDDQGRLIELENDEPVEPSGST